MIALRVLGIASAITFIASAVVAQTAITREKPLIANPTITTKPIAKPLVANPTVKPGRIRADDDASSHLSAAGETIKGSNPLHRRSALLLTGNARSVIH
jgi:hypothetical protein